MADSTLRMKIVSALDNAGLKATNQQLDQIEKSMGKVNRAGSQSMGGLNNELEKAGFGLDKADQKLAKLPGHFGKMAEGMGKVGGAIGMTYAAWKTFEGGVSIGRKIFEQFGDGAGYTLDSIKSGFSNLWDNIKNGFEKMLTGTNMKEQLENEMKMAREAMQSQMKGYEDAANKKIQVLQNEQSQHQKVIDAINRETQAYLSQAQTLQGLKSAKGNSEVLWLEAQKFREKQQYEAYGEYDMAEQIGLAYDVEIQHTKLKHQIDASQMEQRKAAQQAMAEEQKYMARRAKADDADRRFAEAAGEYDDANKAMRHHGGIKEIKAFKEKKRVYDEAMKEYETAIGEEWTHYQEAMSKWGKVAELQQQESNIRMGGETALNMARWNYDKFLDQNGNIANIVFDKDYIEKMNGEYASEEYFKEIAANTDSMAEKLDYLLQMKEQ